MRGIGEAPARRLDRAASRPPPPRWNGQIVVAKRGPPRAPSGHASSVGEALSLEPLGARRAPQHHGDRSLRQPCHTQPKPGLLPIKHDSVARTLARGARPAPATAQESPCVVESSLFPEPGVASSILAGGMGRVAPFPVGSRGSERSTTTDRRPFDGEETGAVTASPPRCHPDGDRGDGALHPSSCATRPDAVVVHPGRPLPQQERDGRGTRRAAARVEAPHRRFRRASPSARITGPRRSSG